jgi:hypothetical protein
LNEGRNVTQDVQARNMGFSLRLQIEREATGKQEAATKLQVLAERIVDDAISADASRTGRCW